MSKIALSGNASGTGTFTIASPNSNSNYQLDLPAESGTVITTASTTGISASALSTGTIPKARMYAGAVLQVVQFSTSTLSSTSSATFVASSLAASITPSSSSSKILVLSDIQCYWGSSGGMGLAIYRGATPVYADVTSYGIYVTQAQTRARVPLNYLDSPATTSSTTYTIYYKAYSGTINICNDSNPSSITLMEIAA